MVKSLTPSLRGYRALTILTPLVMIGEAVMEIVIPFVMGDLINYLNEGVTTRNHKASLKERYHIMVKYYGRIPVMLLHLWFAVRYYTTRLLGRQV